METNLDEIWNSTETVDRYTTRSGLVLGFHGTDFSVAREVVLRRQELKPSTNPWDWIGHGMYFWEYSPSRALEFAHAASRRYRSSIKTPAVLGAVLDLRNCLDLLDYKNLVFLKEVYNTLEESDKLTLRNRYAANGNSDDLLLRCLDCAVIERVHQMNRLNHFPPFDSVKAVFWEGNLLYPNAGFREKNHIQICVRNPNCIKGFFIPQTQ